MIIPETEQEMTEYFGNVIDFTATFQWIYKTRSPNVLIEGVMKEHKAILEEVGMLSEEELLKIISDFHLEGLSDLLNKFLAFCKFYSLDIPMWEFEEKKNINENLSEKGMSRKKFHEAKELGQTISQLITQNNLSSIIDIGSGLGYVDRMVCANCENTSVIAIEADPKKSEKADHLNKNFNGKITQLCQKLTKDSVQNLTQILENEHNISNSCLIALHACGDLSVDCFRLLENCERIKCSILVSCCYHKMSPSNFPLSDYLNQIAESRNLQNLMPTTFLRMAAERPRDQFLNWTMIQFNQHTFSNLARAAIEYYIHTKGNLKVVKLKRKWVRKIAMFSWDSCILDWLDRHLVTDEVNDEPLNRSQLLEDMTNVWLEHEHYFDSLKGLLILQICFQSVAEGFILMDRLLYLKEKHNLQSIKLMRTAQANISARSVAFIINKR